MRLNAWGRAVQDEWMRSADIRAEITLDEFMVMPNHFHAIAIINGPVELGRFDARIGIDGPDAVGVDGRPPLQRRRIPKSLGSLIAGFKSAVTKRINTSRETPGMPVWQREYHDRIIRDDLELERIRRYITDNPAAWDRDRQNPG